MDYWIVPPSDTTHRKTWSIRTRPSPKAKSTLVKDSRIDAVNDLYRTGVCSYETCKDQLKTLILDLKGRRTPSERYLDANTDIVNRYWETEYSSRGIEPSSRQSAWNALQRVIRAVGDLDIAVASKRDLQSAVNRLRPEAQPKVVVYLNSLLVFMKRTERVETRRGNVQAPVYLTLSETLAACSSLTTEQALVVKVAYATGQRLGEVFALDKTRPDGSVWVSQQMHVTGRLGDLKNRRPHDCIVIEPGLPWVHEWETVSYEDKLRLRKVEWAKVMRKATAGKACFHTLRHSYVRWCLDAHIEAQHVADSLGDGLDVFYKYYKGWVQSDSLRAYIRAKMKKTG